MLVHDYYSDLLTSIYRFFNSLVIKPSNSIRSIHYNLEDSASVLEYKDFSKLPSMVISYDSLEQDPKVPVHPRMFQFLSDSTALHLDQIKVLENNSKGISFYVQMRPYVLSLNLSIKVDTQMAALNIKHDILDSFPIDRIVLYNEVSFVSFFELDQKYLIPAVNDVLNDSISNLFLKMNDFGKTGRFFPIEFSPFLKLNGSPSISLDDKTAGTYTVTFSLEVSISSPFKFITDDRVLNNDLANKTRSIKSGVLSPGIFEVPCYSGVVHILVDMPNQKLYSFKSIDLPKHVFSDGTVVTGISIGDSFSFIHEFGTGLMFRYAGGSVRTILDDGRSLTNVAIDDVAMTITGSMLDNSILTLNLMSITQTSIVKNLRLTPHTSYKILTVRDLYSLQKYTPVLRSTLEFAASKIVNVKTIEISTGVVTSTAVDARFLPNGRFSIPLSSLSINIFGEVDKTTSQIITINTDTIGVEVFSLSIEPVYNINPYGADVIERISIDINSAVQSSMSQFDTHTNALEVARVKDLNFLILVSSIIVITNNNPMFPYKFTINIDPTAVTIDPMQVPLGFKHYIIFNEEFVDGFVLMTDQSAPTFLTFKCNESFKKFVLDQLSNTKPMYFGIS